MPRFPKLLLALLLAVPALPQEPLPDPCEQLLAASTDRPAWPGIVLDVPTGDTLLIKLRDIGQRRVRLAGLRAPREGEPMAAVSRFHLSRLAKGLRVFVVLEPPRVWPQEVVAVVEDFAEAQLAAGMGRYLPEEAPLLGAYISCRCLRAQERSRQAKTGLWAP